MGRGFFAGVIWGVGLAGLGLATTSLSLPLPVAAPGASPEAGSDQTTRAAPSGLETAPQARTPDLSQAQQQAQAPRTGLADVPAGSQFNRGRSDGPVRLPVVGGDQPQVSSVMRPEGAAPEAFAFTPDTTGNPGLPDAAGVDSRFPPLPQIGSEAGPGLTLEEVSPVLANPLIQPLVAPRQEGGPDLTSRPSMPSVDATRQTPVQQPEPTAGFPAGDLDAVNQAPEIALATPGALPVPPKDPPGLPSLPGTTAARSPQAPAAPRPEMTPEAAPSEDLAMSAPRPSAPALTVTSAEIPEGESDMGPKVAAIDAFAMPFDASDPRPRMSIVLIDAGTGAGLGTSALRDFPYPVSFAVDVTRPDAVVAMARYRAAGFEVLALAGLPAQDAARNISAEAAEWFAQLPEVVAVMEARPGALQQGRAEAEALAGALSETGHGVLFYPEAGDTTRKLAARAGVPAATLFRDFDAGGEDAAGIGRFLDAAAVRAADAHGVVMVGRLRPETVSALLVWGLADRASQVQLVPVSVVLKAQSSQP